jgi:hypothetical protein
MRLPSLMAVNSDITPKLFDSVAQWGHFAGGAAIVLAVVVISHHRTASVYALLGVTALAAFKEFWYDKRYESVEVQGSSLEDFLFYILGGTLAMLVAIVFG